MSITKVIVNIIDMEEIKREGAKEEMCACHHAGMNCIGSAHRYCFKRCCMLRCFAAIIILGGVFAVGYAAGEGGHRERGEFGRYGYAHQQMMGGAWGNGGENAYYYNYNGIPSGRVIMRQRMTGSIPPISAPATTSEVKKL